MERKLQRARSGFNVKNSVSLSWDKLLYVKDDTTPLIFLQKSPQDKKTQTTQSLKPNSLEP